MPGEKKILILDDDPEILQVLTHILGKQYTLLTKSDTSNLDQDLAEFQPNAIVIDHFIGDKTSIDIINNTLQNNKQIPIILHSAHEEIEKLSRQTNVAAFLRKPSSINEIRNCIAKVLDTLQ